MSTRSRIAMRLANGDAQGCASAAGGRIPGAARYRSVYCHFDGDLVGPVLREHYASEEQAHTIINGGDLRSVWPDKLETYRAIGEPWQHIRPRESADLSLLIELAWDTGAEYLCCWQDDGWQTIEMRGSQ
ncbi:hypothetical protein [Endozoicomonas lisbonensis]|uniref:Uncharacterized protein n=1 Tax=Endozoicomonas lisbonensis TaxID=3120522 RepID=A0ABV2SCE3_9GAMM